MKSNGSKRKENMLKTGTTVGLQTLSEISKMYTRGLFSGDKHMIPATVIIHLEVSKTKNQSSVAGSPLLKWDATEKLQNTILEGNGLDKSLDVKQNQTEHSWRFKEPGWGQ